MTDISLKNSFHIGDIAISKAEIAMILTFDGFGFVASHQGWSEQFAAEKFNELDNIEEKLTNEDCEQFACGFTAAFENGETRYQHVLRFTSNLLKKWGILTGEQTPYSA